jgi:hypothetical protein
MSERTSGEADYNRDIHTVKTSDNEFRIHRLFES